MPVTGVSNVLSGVEVALGMVFTRAGTGELVAVCAGELAGALGGALEGRDPPTTGGGTELRVGSAGKIERSDAGPSRYSSLSW